MVTHVMMRVEEVAREAGISAAVVYANLHSGRLRGYRFAARGRGTWRVARADYELWLQSLRYEELAPPPAEPPRPPPRPPGAFKHLKL